MSYGAFIVPGLIMLAVLTQSVANASFGIYFPVLLVFMRFYQRRFLLRRFVAMGGGEFESNYLGALILQPLISLFLYIYKTL